MKRILGLANVHLTVAASAVQWALFLVLIPVAAGYEQNRRLEAEYRAMHRERPARAEAERGQEDQPIEEGRGTPLDPGREAERYRRKKEASRDCGIALLLALLAGSGAAAASLRIQQKSGRRLEAIASVLASLAVSTGAGMALALTSLPFVIVTLLVLLSD